VGAGVILLHPTHTHPLPSLSAEAEYHGVANAVAECSWLRSLLGELDCPLSSATIVFCDNVSTIYMSKNPVHHKRTKHIELDIHFVREKVAVGDIRVLHVPSARRFADVFTKGLPTSLFNDFRDSLCVSNAAVETGGGGVERLRSARMRARSAHATVRARRAPHAHHGSATAGLWARRALHASRRTPHALRQRPCRSSSARLARRDYAPLDRGLVGSATPLYSIYVNSYT
jgi:hypothetical protein